MYIIIVENINSRIQLGLIICLVTCIFMHVHMHRAHALAMWLLGLIKLPWGHYPMQSNHSINWVLFNSTFLGVCGHREDSYGDM